MTGTTQWQARPNGRHDAATRAASVAPQLGASRAARERCRPAGHGLHFPCAGNAAEARGRTVRPTAGRRFRDITGTTDLHKIPASDTALWLTCNRGRRKCGRPAHAGGIPAGHTAVSRHKFRSKSNGRADVCPGVAPGDPKTRGERAMKIRCLLLAATVMALPVTAMADEPVSGVYVGLGGGFDYMNTVNGKNVTIPATDKPLRWASAPAFRAPICSRTAAGSCSAASATASATACALKSKATTGRTRFTWAVDLVCRGRHLAAGRRFRQCPVPLQQHLAVDDPLRRYRHRLPRQ